MDLRELFYNTVKNWNQDENQIKLQWNELLEKYNESFRKYHNLNHLRELLNCFDTYQHELIHPTEVVYAIYYHDIIYNIWSKKNELNSAELASEYLLIIDMDNRSIERIFNLIMATKDHMPKTNPDEKWMIDFDIAILGQSWEKYLLYTQQIREEYHSVPNLIYKRGRKKILNHFLSKNRIYKTDIFYELFEINARNNLKEELKTL